MSRHRCVDPQHREIKMRLLRASNLCGICGKPIQRMHDASVDHIVPISKGGSESPLNTQIAHVWCNREKGNQP